MSGKKRPLSPKQFRAKTRQYLGKRRPLKGKKASRVIKARTAAYAKSTKLMKDIASTLRQIAASHPDPKARKKAAMAIKKLDDARTGLGYASMCMEIPHTLGAG
jgi:hypothetical protein